MSDWNPDNYLIFKKQRTQPAIDLANRVKEYNPKTIVDIGCGPGNSTVVLKNIFPDADILGIDSSANMINKAKSKHSDICFELCDVNELNGTYDLLFSNACLQWVPEHERLIPRLMNNISPDGILAVQMPMNQDEPLFRIIEKTVSSSKWNFDKAILENNEVLAPDKYFDILSECSNDFDMWENVYYHLMPSHEHMIDWVRSTRLRPYLDVLDDNEKLELESDILSETKNFYPSTASGEVIFKFRRFFFVAHK